MGRIVPYIMEKIKMFQTTNQVLKYVYIYIGILINVIHICLRYVYLLKYGY